MRFTMVVDMDNAAFDEVPELELGAILGKVQAWMRDGLPVADGAKHWVRDSNGARVGYWTLETGEA